MQTVAPMPIPGDETLSGVLQFLQSFGDKQGITELLKQVQKEAADNALLKSQNAEALDLLRKGQELLSLSQVALEADSKKLLDAETDLEAQKLSLAQKVEQAKVISDEVDQKLQILAEEEIKAGQENSEKLLELDNREKSILAQKANTDEVLQKLTEAGKLLVEPLQSFNKSVEGLYNGA